VLSSKWREGAQMCCCAAHPIDGASPESPIHC
jgi:hypothetical protein